MRSPSRSKLLTLALGAAALIGCSDAETPLAPETADRASASTSSSGQTTFSGRATVVDATVLGVNTKLSDTGPLPPGGGAREATLLEVAVDGLLTAQVAHAATVGQGKRSRSEASVANLDLTVEGHRITASFLRSEATAVCEDGAVRTSGNSVIVGLTVDGEEVAVSGEPNQTIELDGAGRVVINEQTESEKAITVNALHVVVPGVADVIVSSAHADIGTCPGDCVEGDDFVTGGGWIDVPGKGNSKANFGVGGGLKNGALWGHLTYIDHPRRLKVKGLDITAYEVVDEITRRIEGTAEVDGERVSYVVEVSDTGEPGRGDTFSIRLSNGYTASGELRGGGNIQLHRPTQGCD